MVDYPSRRVRSPWPKVGSQIRNQNACAICSILRVRTTWVSGQVNLNILKINVHPPKTTFCAGSRLRPIARRVALGTYGLRCPQTPSPKPPKAGSPLTNFRMQGGGVRNSNLPDEFSHWLELVLFILETGKRQSPKPKQTLQPKPSIHPLGTLRRSLGSYGLGNIEDPLLHAIPC